MKKFLSLFLTFAFAFMLALPCFAASAARFNINLVSESNTEAVISIDYEGGTAFACFDAELKYNDKKLKATEAYDGDGGLAFAKAAKMDGGLIVTAINPETNPIKAMLATTVEYKNVDGKDIFVVKFKKLVKEKLTGSDVSLVFTNCMNSERVVINTEVTSSLAGRGEAVESTAQNPSAPTKSENTAQQPSSEAAPVNTEDKTDSQPVDEGSSEASKGEASSDKTAEIKDEKPLGNKKIIVVASAAAVMVAVIVVGCIYVVKKTKNNEEDA